MAVTAEDKARLSQADQQKLADLSTAWTNAKTQAERDSIAAQGKAIRNNAGYDSNADGTYKGELSSSKTTTQPTTQAKTSSSSGSSSTYAGGTTSSSGTKTNTSTVSNTQKSTSTNTTQQAKQGTVSTDTNYTGYTYTGGTTQQGSKGSNVTAIQNALNYLGGYDLGTFGASGNGVDGTFGAKTTEAIKQFQRENGLVVDGIVGAKTGAKLQEAVNNKMSGGGTTQTQKAVEVKVKAEPITVYRITGVDEYGNVQFSPIQGSITYDENGGGHTTIDGDSLQNGDCVQGADGTWWFYDAELGHGVKQAEWEAKYADTLTNNANNTKQEQPISTLSKDQAVQELYNELFNEGANQFLDEAGNLKLDDFLSWYEAQALAQERSNPLYNQALQQSLSNIDKQAIKSGFYGQLPTEALKNQATAEIEAQRNADIMDLANQLVGESRDSAMDKLNALLSAKDSDVNSLLQLLSLAQEYETGSNAGTTGMVSNGTINFGTPDSTPTKYSTTTTTQNNTNKATYDNGNLTKDEVKELQKALGMTGSDVDGYYGSKTREAAKNLDANTAYNTYVGKAYGNNGKATLDFNQSEGAWTMNLGGNRTTYNNVGELLRALQNNNVTNYEELGQQIVNDMLSVLEQTYSGQALNTQLQLLQKQLNDAGFDIQITQ